MCMFSTVPGPCKSSLNVNHHCYQLSLHKWAEKEQMDLTVACADMFKNKQIQTLLLTSLSKIRKGLVSLEAFFIFQGLSLKYCFAPKTENSYQASARGCRKTENN